MEKLTETRQIGNLFFRVQTPPGNGPYPLVLMLHGLSGDENVMWIFADRLPQSAIILAPRGLYTSELGGYTWHSGSHQTPSSTDLLPAVAELNNLLIAENFPTADLANVHLLGFSQGAALAYTFALMHPQRVTALAALAGFLPDGLDDLIASHPLTGKHVYIAHGSQDRIVPVAEAEKAAQAMHAAGAEVSFCADEVGHKLSASCFRELEQFFGDLNRPEG